VGGAEVLSDRLGWEGEDLEGLNAIRIRRRDEAEAK
jgi:hypothetical protein